MCDMTFGGQFYRHVLNYNFNDKAKISYYIEHTTHKIKAGCCCWERTVAVVLGFARLFKKEA